MSSIADSDMSSSNVKREPNGDGEWVVFVWAEFLFNKYQIDANNTSRRPIDISMIFDRFGQYDVFLVIQGIRRQYKQRISLAATSSFVPMTTLSPAPVVARSRSWPRWRRSTRRCRRARTRWTPDDVVEFVWAEFLFDKYQIDANNTSRRPIDISMIFNLLGQYVTSHTKNEKEAHIVHW